MDRELKYNNIIISASEKEGEVPAEDLTANYIEAFDYRSAIEKKIADKRDKGTQYGQAKKEVEASLKSKIEAMQKVAHGLRSYERISENETKLADIENALRKSGALEDRKIQRILRLAQKANIKEKQAAENEIFENIEGTKGLPISAGFISDKKIDEESGMRKHVFQRFKLDDVQLSDMKMLRKTVGIDVKSLEEFCKATRDVIYKRTVQNKERNKEEKEIRALAYKKGIEPEEAEQIILEEDKRQRLGLEYEKGLGEIETIKGVLDIRELPKEVKEEFSADQIERYKKEKVKTREECKKYEEKFSEISDKENGLKAAKDILLNFSKSVSPTMSDKHAEKLRKALEKYMEKQEKKINKEKSKLDKMRTGKSLSRYFENMDSYRELLNADKRYSSRLFDSFESLHTERDKELVNDDELVTVGKYDEEKVQQDKEFIIKMFEAEVHSALSNNKSSLALPPPPKNSELSKESEFDKSIKVDLEQISEKGVEKDNNAERDTIDKENIDKSDEGPEL